MKNSAIVIVVITVLIGTGLVLAKIAGHGSGCCATDAHHHFHTQ